MGIDDPSKSPDATICADIDHIILVLQDCLTHLDTFNVPVAAAHLSACLDNLEQKAKSD